MMITIFAVRESIWRPSSHNSSTTFPREAQVDLLYRQIGQLKVENDLYEGFGVKPDIFPGSVTARFLRPGLMTSGAARRSDQDHRPKAAWS
jgi:hypothetical protein